MIRKGQLRDINELEQQKRLCGPMRQEEALHVNQNCKLMSKKYKDITIKHIHGTFMLISLSN